MLKDGNGHMKKINKPHPIFLFALLSLCAFISCQAEGAEATDAVAGAVSQAIDWYPAIDTGILSASENVDFISGLKAYQQTTDYTCGPSAILSLARYYGLPGIDVV